MIGLVRERSMQCARRWTCGDGSQGLEKVHIGHGWRDRCLEAYFLLLDEGRETGRQRSLDNFRWEGGRLWRLKRRENWLGNGGRHDVDDSE